MTQPIKPFTQQHAQLVRDGLRKLADADELIRKQEICGKDCENDKNLSRMLRETLENFRLQFTEPPPVQS